MALTDIEKKLLRRLQWEKQDDDFSDLIESSDDAARTALQAALPDKLIQCDDLIRQANSSISDYQKVVTATTANKVLWQSI